jgi:two-component system cell cycle sensor histidine kinase/response regulator CckA
MEQRDTVDITDQNLSEFLSGVDTTVLEMISSGAPVSDVLQLLCRMIEEQSPSMLCSILLLEADRKTLRHGAAPNLPQGFIQAIDGLTIGPNVGSCGTAAYRAVPVIVSDIARDPLWAGYKELALSHGLRACWSTPIFSKQGDVLGTFAIYYREPRSPSSRDLQLIERATHLVGITVERKQAEVALRQAESRYRSLVENAIEGIFQTTPDGGYVSVNSALARMYGYQSAEELMSAVQDIGRQVYVDPNRRTEFKRVMEEQGVVQDFEYQVYDRAGNKIWLSENSRAVRDAGGEILYYEGTVEDISEGKRVEQGLRDAEAKFRTLVEQLPAITYIAEGGTAGRWTYVSPQILSLLGFSVAEWMSDPGSWAKQLHPDDRERVLAEVVLCRDQARPFRSEYRMFARDGRELWFLNEAAAMKGPASEPDVFQGVMYDITERKQLEEQLRQAQRMESIGRLAGGVAHDFNNLLMVIQGHSEVIEQRLDPGEPLRKNTEAIRKAAEKAASLTRQLLAFSRMQMIEPKVLDLNVVLADMGKMLPRLIGEDIELSIRPSVSLGRVKADQSQIEQIILNLAVNARDAMPEGGRLTIETSDVELDDNYSSRHAGVRPGNYVMLAVSDTGVGMDSQTQAHVFEPFFTTKELGKGTGLGLATVYGVVKQSRGWIWVYSELGRGTTFKIYLPRVSEAVTEPEVSKAHPTPPPGTETILLAEDQDSIRDLTRECLEASGYTVLEARNGVEAVQLAEQHRGTIDLLVTDVVMPKMGGRELARRLTTLCPQVKVLYMSGYAEYGAVEHGILDLDLACLQKPFSLALLLHKVREVLDEEALIGVPGVEQTERKMT